MSAETMKIQEKHMHIKEVMTKKVITIEKEKTVLDACKKYSRNLIGCLVVVENDRPVGIVTERDMIQRVIVKKRDPEKTKVKDIMSTNLIMIPPNATVEYDATTLMKYKIKKLPIVDNNKMVGIATVTDIAALVQDLSKIVVAPGYPFKEINVK